MDPKATFIDLPRFTSLKPHQRALDAVAALPLVKPPFAYARSMCGRGYRFTGIAAEDLSAVEGALKSLGLITKVYSDVREVMYFAWNF